MAVRFVKRPAPSPSFDRGWRLGVAIAANGLLVAIAWFLLLILGEVLGA